MTAPMPTSMTAPMTADDLALLRRFEPVLRFNAGEQFYPMDVERYLAGARLYVRRPDEHAELLVPRSGLDVARLAEPRDDVPGAVYYVSVADPLDAARARAFRRTSTLRDFHPGPGRLVRVGLLARLFDLLFSLALFLRGTAPGGQAAAAALHYQELQARDERYSYYGRVIRDQGYIALQYWFFYAFNDWRSSFHGVNDHEGDWELVTVYAAADRFGAIQPIWLAYSAHDSDGDDLRRRWDDPALEWVGDHPVVYAGAGSHANYFFRGEYMPAVPLPFTERAARVWLSVRRGWTRIGQGEPPDAGAVRGGFRIPFVDYARGDGLAIGPGERRGWELRPLQATPDAPEPAWVDGYPGLWGLYSGDPAGENGPPGPKYERDGTQRRRWYDPLGWGGLDKVPAPGAAVATMDARRRQLRDEQEALTRRIEEAAARATGLQMEAEAIGREAGQRARSAALQRQMREADAALAALKAERAASELAEADCARHAARLAAGDLGDPRAHLRHPTLPTSPETLRLGRAAAIWSAASIGVLLLGLAVLSRFTNYLVPGAALLLGVYAVVEALFHRTVQALIGRVVVGLAVLTALVLVAQFFLPLVLALVVVVGIFTIVENLREVAG